VSACRPQRQSRTSPSWQEEHITPAATPPMGRPAAPGAPGFFSLGYSPTGACWFQPRASRAGNAHLQPAPADFIASRRLIWAAVPAVAHGFSGGPVLDPSIGAVVGIVRGMVDSARLQAGRAAAHVVFTLNGGERASGRPRCLNWRERPARRSLDRVTGRAIPLPAAFRPRSSARRLRAAPASFQHLLPRSSAH
jgi:hypothetical protein